MGLEGGGGFLVRRREKAGIDKGRDGKRTK